MTAVLVTGSAGALGTAIVAHLRADGFAVVGVDAREPADVVADVCSAEGRTAALAAVRDAGPVAGLVNCAGIIPTAPALEASVDDWERAFRVNVEAPYFLACSLAADLAATNGTIVNIGSIAGSRPSPHNLVYGATKAALASVTTSLAAALAGQGVRVNTVSPGLIDTPLSDRTDERLASLSGRPTVDVAATRTGAVPLGRRGTPAEVAAVVAFLLSSGAGYLTGQALHVNGGAHPTT